MNTTWVTLFEDYSSINNPSVDTLLHFWQTGSINARHFQNRTLASQTCRPWRKLSVRWRRNHENDEKHWNSLKFMKFTKKAWLLRCFDHCFSWFSVFFRVYPGLVDKPLAGPMSGFVRKWWKKCQNHRNSRNSRKFTKKCTKESKECTRECTRRCATRYHQGPYHPITPGTITPPTGHPCSTGRSMHPSQRLWPVHQAPFRNNTTAANPFILKQWFS